MPPAIDPHDFDLGLLFPSLPEDQRADMRSFLDGYCEVALEVFERLERDRRSGIDPSPPNS